LQLIPSSVHIAAGVTPAVISQRRLKSGAVLYLRGHFRETTKIAKKANKVKIIVSDLSTILSFGSTDF